MQMCVARTRVATVADKADLLSDSDGLPLGKARYISRQMRVIGQPTPIRRANIGGRAPGFALKQLGDAPCHCRDHRRTPRGRNVDRLMQARATVAGLEPRINETVGRDTNNWNHQYTSGNRCWGTGRGRHVGKAGMLRRRDDEHADRNERCQDKPGETLQGWNTAGTPAFTISDSRAASQLVRRMHPFDSARPILSGSGVPWMP